MAVNAYDKEELKDAVREAVHEQLPESLIEQLSPLIARTVKDTNRPFRRWMVTGYIVLVVAFGLLFDKLGNQADSNSHSNNRQDCYLAGLIRFSLDDPKLTLKQRLRAVQVVVELERGKDCRRKPPTAKRLRKESQ